MSFTKPNLGFWKTRVGPWECMEIHDGWFRLDGGAMFGVVPKVLWNRMIPADEENRIPLALRCLLLRGNDRLALIDTGIGTKWSEKERGMYAIDHSENDLARSLAHWGVGFEDITDVLITHMHFDHVGGATICGEGGRLRPAFPNATYWCPEENLAHASRPEERDNPSYIPANWEPLQEAGCFRTFVPDGSEVLPGVSAEPTDGHTLGMVTYHVHGGDHPLVYCADLVPTASHVRLNYVMGYDLCPRRTMVEKRTFLERAVEGGWTLFFEHDPEGPAARVKRDVRGRYTVVERLPAPEDA